MASSLEYRKRGVVKYLKIVVSKTIEKCLHFLVLPKTHDSHAIVGLILFMYLNRNIHINIFAHTQLYASIFSFAYILMYCLK